MIDFSIIIPAKNEEKYLAGCLDSINAINYPKDLFEIIVVDNGSTDRTVDIANNKCARLFFQPNLTISGLRNFGASQAQGRVLAFLDADCAVSENWLTDAAAYLGRSGIAAFGSAPVLPDHATWVQRAWQLVRKKRNVVQEVQWLESMNLFVPAEVFHALGGFNEELITCEDYELSTRLKKKGKIVSDQKILVVHHGEAASVAHFFRKERWRATSNYRGISSRKVVLSEWPSIVLPLVQLLFTAIVLLLAVMTGLGLVGMPVVLIFILIWQTPLLLSACKTSGPANPVLMLQLLVLFNVYFLARGCAVFGGGRR
jgi:glycosyltransferase involved in cell wall biosynthesis